MERKDRIGNWTAITVYSVCEDRGTHGEPIVQRRNDMTNSEFIIERTKLFGA
jgi:hypothetical protein